MTALALPQGAWYGPNCGVTAVAIAAGVSMLEAWNTFKKVCNMHKNWKGATRQSERLKALDALGVKYENLSIFAGRTLGYFCNVSKDKMPGTMFIVTTTGHVQIVMDGKIVDQGGVKNMEDHWGKLKRISGYCGVLEIIPKDPDDTLDVALAAQVFGLPLFDLNTPYKDK